MMEELKIKILEEIDLSDKEKVEIESLNRHFFPDNLTNDKYIFGRKEKNPRRVLIENIYGEVLGDLLFVEREIVVGKEWLKVLYIGEIMVREDEQGKGLGKKLIEKFLETAINLNNDLCLLICVPEKEGFYLKSGLMKLNDRIGVVLKNENDVLRIADGIIMGKIFTSKGEGLLRGGMMINLGLPV